MWMKRSTIASMVLLLWSGLGLVSCSGKGDRPVAGDRSGKLRIAVIPKGTTHEFWKSVQAGALQAGREVGAEVIWKGSQREDDRAQQVTVVEDFINSRVDGIVLAPLDDRALIRPVQEAVRENIPVVIIDSALQGDAFISYIATDNYQGGVLAARKLGSLLGGKGRIILIRYVEGSASTSQREAGFLDTVKAEFPGLYLIVQDQYAGVTTETAYQLTENLISRFPGVEGLFTPNESTTFGAMRALQEAGLAGKVRFVGFDSSPKLIQALRDRQIDALIIQNPMQMGYLGVKTIVAHIKGETVSRRLDTGVVVATADNMDVPEVKALLEPDFSGIQDR